MVSLKKNKHNHVYRIRIKLAFLKVNLKQKKTLVWNESILTSDVTVHLSLLSVWWMATTQPRTMKRFDYIGESGTIPEQCVLSVTSTHHQIIHAAQVEWEYHLPCDASKRQSPWAMSVLFRWPLTWQDSLPLSTSCRTPAGPRVVLFTDIGNKCGDCCYSLLPHFVNISKYTIMHEITNGVMGAMITSIQMSYFLYVLSAMRDITFGGNHLKIYDVLNSAEDLVKLITNQ